MGVESTMTGLQGGSSRRHRQPACSCHRRGIEAAAGDGSSAARGEASYREHAWASRWQRDAIAYDEIGYVSNVTAAVDARWLLRDPLQRGATSPFDEDDRFRRAVGAGLSAPLSAQPWWPFGNATVRSRRAGIPLCGAADW